MDRDFVYDHALRIFAKTQTCSEIFLLVQPLKAEKLKSSSMIRSLLCGLMWSVIKAKDMDINTLRLTFENFPDLMKDICELIEGDKKLKNCYDKYYQEVVEFFQLLVNVHHSCTIKGALKKLMQDTAKFIGMFVENISPPIVLQVFEHYEKKLQEKLAEYQQYGDQSDEQVSSVESREVAGDETDTSLLIVKEPDFESDAQSEHFEAEVQLPTSSLLSQTSGENEKKSDESVIKVSSPENIICNNHNSVSTSDKATASSQNMRQTVSESSQEYASNSSCDVVSVNAVVKKMHKKRMFAISTDAMLIHGVKTYGSGCWKVILENYKFPSFRTHVHLKDRWRTMQTKNIVKCTNGKVKILKKKHIEAYQNLCDTIAERQKRQVPTIDLSQAQAFQLSSSPRTLRSREKLSNHDGSTSGEDEQNLEMKANCENQDEEAKKKSMKNATDTSPQRERSVSDNQLPTSSTRVSPRKSVAKDQTDQPSTSHANDNEYRRQKRRRRLWDVEGESLTWNNDPILQPKFSSKLQNTPSDISEKRHRRKPWSEAEVANLIEGVRRYGVGQWAMILNSYKFFNRTSVMIKDKYRSILKNDELPQDLLPVENR